MTSRSEAPSLVSFRDAASRSTLRVALEPGQAALGFVLRDGRLAARYGEWRVE